MQEQYRQLYDGSPGTESMNEFEEELNDEEKEDSFGTGSFTTNTFNARLASSHGMQMLKYIQSEDFGKHGESIKLIANIQVSTNLEWHYCSHVWFFHIFHMVGIYE